MAEPAFYRCKGCSCTWQRTEWRTRANRPPICPHCASGDQETDQAREDAYIHDVYGALTQHIGQTLNKILDKTPGESDAPVNETAPSAPTVLTAGIDMPSNATHHGALPLGVKWCTACERTDCAHTKEAGISPANQRQHIPVLRNNARGSSSMTRDEAHDALRSLARTSDDSPASWGAAYVLDEVTHLRQLLRDLIDFDMGEMPELDGLCAVEGPRKIARMVSAWKAAIAEVGPRNQPRFEGDVP